MLLLIRITVIVFESQVQESIRRCLRTPYFLWCVLRQNYFGWLDLPSQSSVTSAALECWIVGNLGFVDSVCGFKDDSIVCYGLPLCNVEEITSSCMEGRCWLNSTSYCCGFWLGWTVALMNLTGDACRLPGFDYHRLYLDRLGSSSILMASFTFRFGTVLLS